VTVFSNFGLLSTFGTDEARNFKFGIQIDVGKYHLTPMINSSKGDVVRMQGLS